MSVPGSHTTPLERILLGTGLLGAVVVMFHGTLRNAFSRFRRDRVLYLAPRAEQARDYARGTVLTAQRVPERARGSPAVLSVAVDPGRILDVSTPDGARVFAAALEDYVGTLKYVDSDTRAHYRAERLLSESLSIRNGMKLEAIPYTIIERVAPFVSARGYDSAWVSEGHFQSLAVFKPGERAKILRPR